ncbi:MAG TPA: hypothetical protein H9676_04945 [Firmicutes bacterium]|nr:hypothetical protein [Bacillota bacterium]
MTRLAASPFTQIDKIKMHRIFQIAFTTSSKNNTDISRHIPHLSPAFFCFREKMVAEKRLRRQGEKSSPKTFSQAMRSAFFMP